MTVFRDPAARKRSVLETVYAMTPGVRSFASAKVFRSGGRGARLDKSSAASIHAIDREHSPSLPVPQAAWQPGAQSRGRGKRLYRFHARSHEEKRRGAGGRHGVEGDTVAVVGDNYKLLLFAFSELAEMSRDRGAMLQRYHDVGLADA
jgi:hypothetical protein